MKLFKRLKSALDRLDSRSSFTEPGDNFICGSCRTTFERQFQNCSNCGSPILVPIEDQKSGESNHR